MRQSFSLLLAMAVIAIISVIAARQSFSLLFAMAVIAIMSVISVWQSFVLSSACQCQLWQLLLLCQLFQRGIRSLFCVQCQLLQCGSRSFFCLQRQLLILCQLLLRLWQSFSLLPAMLVVAVMSVIIMSVTAAWQSFSLLHVLSAVAAELQWSTEDKASLDPQRH